jgi:outer membrane protein assembly factor BamD
MNVLLRTLFFSSFALFAVSCGSGDDAPRLASDTRASDPKAQVIFNEGLAAEKSGNIKRALKNYRTVSTKYPLFLSADEAAYRRGKLLERTGEPLDAFDAFDDVLTKYPASKHYAESMKRQQKIALDTANGNIKESFIGLVKTRVSVKDTARMLTKVRENAPRAPSAELAQFTLGRLYQKEGGPISSDRAIAAYRELTREYPDSKYAPEAQYQIGKILLSYNKKGNMDSANLDRAKRAFDDILIGYPDSKQAALAKKELARISTGEIQRTFDIAEFYRKKGNISSALFYYQETVNRSKSGPLHDEAKRWINELAKP